MDDLEHPTYEILTKQKVLVVNLSGKINLDSLLTLVKRMYADDNYDPTFDAVIDTTHAQFDLDADAMSQYIWEISNDPRRVRGRTVLVSSTDIGYGMNRMYGGLASELQDQLHFERSIEAAFAWLNATDAPTDQGSD